MNVFGFINKHRYEIISLLTGASVMILEIVGARLIAPHFGTSTYVWTSMIGVILGSLSLGFWYGGRLADKYDTSQDLGLIIAGAALLVLVMSFLQAPVLEMIANQRLDLRLSSILAATVLFGPPSMLIGMVSPHLAKLRVTSLKTTGTAIGRLEAAGAIGSIGGTFLSGYWLLAYLGARSITLWLVVLLVVTSFLANIQNFVWTRTLLIAIAILLLGVPSLPRGIIHESDSAYSHYRVAQKEYTKGRPANLLLTDNYSIQSAVYLDDSSEPVFPYAQTITKIVQSAPHAKRILIIGGGAHTLPTTLSNLRPELRIDVVEIDAALDSISRRFFGYSDKPNVHAYYEDGRTFINGHQEKYDLILMDAFNSLTPPFHLTSREAAAKLKQNLAPDGAIIVNSPAYYNNEFLPSLKKTYADSFSKVSVHQVENMDLKIRQNFLIIATNDSQQFKTIKERLFRPLQLQKPGILLTDNYAPVERLSY